jgi:polyisoprenoid-binding protein YceI
MNVVIDVGSMHTDADKLTAHLKSPDFFEVKRYPEAKFVSTAVKKSKSGHTVTGDLTLHGETKELSFPAEIAVDAKGLKLVAKFKIDRNDWGISYGKGMINDEVALNIDVTAKK